VGAGDYPALFLLVVPGGMFFRLSSVECSHLLSTLFVLLNSLNVLAK